MIRQQAEAIIARFEARRVLVVGDLMADEHIWGHVHRVSPEAPVLVVDVEEETFVPGGAANAANQLRAFGAHVVLAGVVGADAAGQSLTERLSELGMDTGAIVISPDRPTTRKTRVVAGTQQGAQQVVRVDREKRSPLPPDIAATLIRKVTGQIADCDALLFSDYTKGVLSEETVRTITEAARAEKPHIVITANPKPASVRFFADADIAQLNRSEADEALRAHLFESPDNAVFHQAGVRLREYLGLRNLLVTRSAQGLTVFTQDGKYTDIPPHRIEVFDGTGAGDSTIAGVTLALAAGATMVEAVEIGNASGGAVVRKVGVATATREEIATLFN
ncbi:MAG: D-glycero-beta-D-manno-heptose-7-phosphate kinase [Fibrella sp.]|nr:D-glycero-beta-D-manno-heptose-7-phosphate kinase [Armatimonadota bacterium]